LEDAGSDGAVGVVHATKEKAVRMHRTKASQRFNIFSYLPYSNSGKTIYVVLPVNYSYNIKDFNLSK
jgi:hypothetical protein